MSKEQIVIQLERQFKKRVIQFARNILENSEKQSSSCT
jgi:hypothetical protein